jgi:hypothetical protein
MPLLKLAIGSSEQPPRSRERICIRNGTATAMFPRANIVSSGVGVGLIVLTFAGVVSWEERVALLRSSKPSPMTASGSVVVDRNPTRPLGQPDRGNVLKENPAEPFSIYLASTEEQQEAIREWALFADVMVAAQDGVPFDVEKDEAFKAARHRFPDHPIDLIDMRAFSGAGIVRIEPHPMFCCGP